MNIKDNKSLKISFENGVILRDDDNNFRTKKKNKVNNLSIEDQLNTPDFIDQVANSIKEESDDSTSDNFGFDVEDMFEYEETDVDLEKLSDEEIDENLRKRQEKLKEEFLANQKRLKSLGLLTEEEAQKNEDDFVKQLKEMKDTYEKGERLIKENIFSKIDPDKLEKKGYPKMKFDPTDIEYNKKGEPEYFFNIKKTLAKNKLAWIMKIFGEDRLVAATYNNVYLNNYADRQHKKVVEYNNKEPHEQYFHDFKRNLAKGFALFLIAVILIIRFTLVKLPEIRYQEAKQLYDSENYEASYEGFEKIKRKNKEAGLYSVLSIIHGSLNQNNFDDAMEYTEELKKFADIYTEAEYYTLVKDIQLKHGSFLYQQKKYEEAIDKLKELPENEIAKEYLNKSYYQLGEKNFNEGNMIEAIEMYGLAENYSDSKEKLDGLAENIYDEALLHYTNGEYSKAKEIFDSLKIANYKDSKVMAQQCLYKEAVALYRDDKYDEAISKFNEIRTFKDSLTMANESIYKKANNLILTAPAAANLELTKIRRYKDVESLILLPNIAIYGEWAIIEADGSPVDDITFLFNANNEILSSNPIRNIDISQPADVVTYELSGNVFKSSKGESSIEPDIHSDGEHMTLIAEKDGITTEYLCERKQSLSHYMGLGGKLTEDDNMLSEDLIEVLDKYLEIYVNENNQD